MPRPNLTSALTAAAVFAGTTCPVLADERPGADHPHSEPADTAIVVAGHLPSDFSLLEGSTVLAGEALVRALKPQIGEMLADLPGASASGFAPGASRPVIRGFDAERVQVLIDGLGAIDASSVSADHAVALDTLSIEHVDLIHGPAVLLFGGRAIGGAVNVIDRRIPRRVPDGPEVAVLASLASAARERSGGVALDLPLAPRLAVHLDASAQRTGDLRTGGRLVSDTLRRDLLAQADAAAMRGDDEAAAHLTESAQQRGRVPGTATRSTTLGAGIAFIDSGGDLGLSVQRYDSRYGIATRPGTGGDDDQGSVSIYLAQTRIDLRGSATLGGPIERLLVRAAYGDYGHVELEGDEIGTRFDREGVEGRVELIQQRRGLWHGHIGTQFAARTLSLEGDEAILPDNADTQFGLFTLQGLDLGRLSLEAAARYERAAVKTRRGDFERGFDLVSGALGLSFDPVQGLRIGGNYLHGARAPSAEELLSNGFHVATQAFEIGDSTFRSEQSDTIEIYARHEGARSGLSLTGFATDFSSFIVAAPTGEERDGFPVLNYVQQPARYRGFEASGHVEAMRWSGGGLRLDASADYVHARLKGGGPVPRIPPLRLRGSAEARWAEWEVRGGVEWNARQPRVAEGEPVSGYTLLNADITWHPGGSSGPLTLILAAENLLDVVGRRATSFTRDYVPVAGRDVRLTVSLGF